MTQPPIKRSRHWLCLDCGKDTFEGSDFGDNQLAYGAAAAQQLATTDPAKAVINPDNQTYINFGDTDP